MVCVKTQSEISMSNSGTSTPTSTPRRRAKDDPGDNKSSSSGSYIAHVDHSKSVKFNNSEPSSPEHYHPSQSNSYQREHPLQTLSININANSLTVPHPAQLSPHVNYNNLPTSSSPRDSHPTHAQKMTPRHTGALRIDSARADDKTSKEDKYAERKSGFALLGRRNSLSGTSSSSISPRGDKNLTPTRAASPSPRNNKDNRGSLNLTEMVREGKITGTPRKDKHGSPLSGGGTERGHSKEQSLARTPTLLQGIVNNLLPGSATSSSSSASGAKSKSPLSADDDDHSSPRTLNRSKIDPRLRNGLNESIDSNSPRRPTKEGDPRRSVMLKIKPSSLALDLQSLREFKAKEKDFAPKISAACPFRYLPLISEEQKPADPPEPSSSKTQTPTQSSGSHTSITTQDEPNMYPKPDPTAFAKWHMEMTDKFQSRRVEVRSTQLLQRMRSKHNLLKKKITKEDEAANGITGSGSKEEGILSGSIKPSFSERRGSSDRDSIKKTAKLVQKLAKTRGGSKEKGMNEGIETTTTTTTKDGVQIVPEKRSDSASNLREMMNGSGTTSTSSVSGTGSVRLKGEKRLSLNAKKEAKSRLSQASSQSPGSLRGGKEIQSPGSLRGGKEIQSPGSLRGGKEIQSPGSLRGGKEIQSPGSLRGSSHASTNNTIQGAP